LVAGILLNLRAQLSAIIAGLRLKDDKTTLDLVLNRMKRLVVLLSALLFVLAGCSEKRPEAETIITDAKIYTLDVNQP
jgi:hypothetical protein